MPDPVIVVASLAVTDMAAFQTDYAQPLQAINKRHGVEAVAVSPSTEAVEGTTPGVTAILRFPDRAAFDAWYSDPDYQPLLARRRALTDLDRSSLVVLPAG